MALAGLPMLRKVLFAFCCSVPLLLAGRPAGAVAIVSAPTITVGVADTFTVDVSIAGVTDLTSWQFDLTFDPSIVQANSFAEGSFMSGFGATLFGPPVIDNTTGLISLATDSYVDFGTNPSGSGVLAEISFTALGAGVSALTFSNAFLNLSDQGFGIQGGQITVTGPASVPEPSTLALMALGLVLIGAQVFARRYRPAAP